MSAPQQGCRIVTLTLNPAVDTSLSVERMVPVQKLRTSVPRHEPGGGGINVVRAVSRLRGDATAVYAAGGHTGALLTELLDAEGVRHHRVVVAANTRDNHTINDQMSGEQYRLVLPGAPLTAHELRQCVDAAFDRVTAGDYLVLSGSPPPGSDPHTYAEIAARARRVGVHVVLDASGDALRAAARTGVLIVKPNRRELAQLVGRALDDVAAVKDAAREIARSGAAHAVIVSLAEQGAVLATAEGVERIEVPAVEVRSAVGAGDCTVAGLTLALARGRELPDAVRYGVAAGTAAVLTPDTELCRLGDTERLYAEIGGR